MSDRATSFGHHAAVYDRARPEYPAEAVEWMLGDAGPDVLDVGAGTGKLSRAVLATGRRVVAVDPDPAMLAQLTARAPELPTLVGRGEQLPVADGSADAVVFGQSWHWVDQEAASVEVGRALRPGGVLGLIWNVRDRSVPWAEEFAELVPASGAEILIAGPGPRVTAPFGELQTRTFGWTRELDADQLVDLTSSRSELITASVDRRTAILDAVRELADRAADANGLVTLPYVTHVFRAVRRA